MPELIITQLAWVTTSVSPIAMHNFVTIRIGEIVFTRLLFYFVCGFVRQTNAEIVAPISMFNTSNGVENSVPFMGPVIEAPHLRGQITEKPPTKDVNRQFLSKSQKSLNFDIIKTTEPIRIIFCAMIKTTKKTSRVVPRMRTANPRLWLAAILKILNL